MYPECMADITPNKVQVAGELHKVTVNLIQLAWDAANKTATLKGLSRTDVINRALQAYAWLEEEAAAGAEVFVRPKDGELERVKFL